MKILKKIGVVLLSIILVCCISLFIFSFSVHMVLVKELKTVIVEECKDSMSEDFEISRENVDAIFENDDISSLIENYIDEFIYGMAGQTNLTFEDIKKDIVLVIDNNKDFIKGNLDTTDEVLDEFKNSEELDNISNGIYDSFVNQEDEDIMIAKTYTNLISVSFKIKMFIAICVLTLLIWLLQRTSFKTMKTFGICSIISSILVSLIIFLLKIIVQSVSEIEMTINYTSGLIYSIIVLIIGIGLIVYGNILKKNNVGE